MALLLGLIFCGYPVGCVSTDRHPVGLLVGLVLETNRAVLMWLVDFDSASTWLVSGVL